MARGGPRDAVLALTALVAITGCLQPASRSCDDGGACPSGLRCAAAGEARTCVPATCGNNVLDPGESCDDGNNVSGDGCPFDCGHLPCGNGRLDPGEECDDGGNIPGNGCSATCRFEDCGNGVLDPHESCDDGNRLDGDGCSSRCTHEGGDWLALDTAPPPRTGHAMAHDATRGTVLLFGGRGGDGPSSDTWVWDGVVWQQRNPALIPPPRVGHAMAYDADRRRIVMFGGGGLSERSTWEWDGSNWIEVRPAMSPGAQLADAAMTYDAARHRVVLFGGKLGSFDQSRTWEWDGTTWREIAIVASPPPRSGHLMGYDSARGKVVMFGGIRDGVRLDDTWELDGVTWTRRLAAAAPSARAHGGMTYCAATMRIMVFGGDSDAGLLADTWEWDGASWTAALPGVSPPARAGLALACDAARGTAVLFGGERLTDPAVAIAGLASDTWEWDGTIWAERAPRLRVPAARQAHGMAYDPARRKVVMFGGSSSDAPLSRISVTNDTWEWDGARWSQIVSPGAPSPRLDFAIATAGPHVMLFGGAQLGPYGLEATSDTWVLDDTQWIQQTPPGAPPMRIGHAMVYDAASGRVVLFGGRDQVLSPTAFDDTWEWDATSWTRRRPAHQPPPRWYPAMAYDAARGCVVLFGGVGYAGGLADTWEWDGTDWSLRSPATTPPAQRYTMSYDPARARAVLFGGSQTWEWDGIDWHLQAPAAAPPGRDAQAMTYDPARARTVVFGGIDVSSGHVTADVWDWDGVHWRPAPPVTASPPARVASAMAYDAARGAAVMFGGAPSPANAAAGLGDTWIWDGARWREQTPTASPPGRLDHAMAFDAERQRIVLFGGTDGSGHPLSDTWEWDGTTWLDRAPAKAPGAHRGQALVYDAARKMTLLLGGTSARQWTWDGTRWIDLELDLAPDPRIHLGATYDAARARVVVFGGASDSYCCLGDTWEWDGKRWSYFPAMRTSPAPRAGHTLVYDTTRKRSVLFGGRDSRGVVLGDVWEWDGATWRQLDAASGPSARTSHVMACDPVHAELVMFGGVDTIALRDTWLFRRPSVVTPAP